MYKKEKIGISSADMAEDDKDKAPGAEASPEKPSEKQAAEKPAEKPAKEAPPRPAPPKNPIEDDVRARFGDTVELKYGFLDLEIHVKPEELLEICGFLKNHPTRPHTFLRNLTAVDWKDAGQIEVVYHIAPLPDATSVCVKCRAPRDAAKVTSVTGLWPSAEWLEREVYDLFGVGFENHPDPRRIMLPPEWEGHPLRKDYEHKEPALPWIPKGLELKS